MQENKDNFSHQESSYPGQKWLVEERDACGVGFIADTKGQASHKLVEQSLAALSCLEHRGGCSADQDSGDGSGEGGSVVRSISNLSSSSSSQIGPVSGLVALAVALAQYSNSAQRSAISVMTSSKH